MAIRTRDGEPGKPAIDPRLLEVFKNLYSRNKELFHKLFPRFHGKSFAEFSEHFEAMCSEVKKEGGRRTKIRSGDAMMQRSASIGSPRITSRGVGGDEDQLKLERFKVRTVDIDGDPPAGGGGSDGSSGQSGPKPGGSKPK